MRIGAGTDADGRIGAGAGVTLIRRVRQASGHSGSRAWPLISSSNPAQLPSRAPFFFRRHLATLTLWTYSGEGGMLPKGEEEEGK